MFAYFLVSCLVPQPVLDSATLTLRREQPVLGTVHSLVDKSGRVGSQDVMLCGSVSLHPRTVCGFSLSLSNEVPCQLPWK